MHFLVNSQKEIVMNSQPPGSIINKYINFWMELWDEKLFLPSPHPHILDVNFISVEIVKTYLYYTVISTLLFILCQIHHSRSSIHICESVNERVDRWVAVWFYESN